MTTSTETKTSSQQLHIRKAADGGYFMTGLRDKHGQADDLVAEQAFSSATELLDHIEKEFAPRPAGTPPVHTSIVDTYDHVSIGGAIAKVVRENLRINGRQPTFEVASTETAYSSFGLDTTDVRLRFNH